MRVRATSGGKTQSFRALLEYSPGAMLLTAYTPLGTSAMRLYASGDRVLFLNDAENTTWSGTPEEFAVPGGPFVRVDTHGFPGWTVTPHYDPLLAKVVVWGRNRDEIVCRMDRALEEFRVHGPHVCTHIPFLRTVLAHPLFPTAQHTTGLV